jgi:hypothetical protein
LGRCRARGGKECRRHEIAGQVEQTQIRFEAVGAIAAPFPLVPPP